MNRISKVCLSALIFYICLVSLCFSAARAEAEKVGTRTSTEQKKEVPEEKIAENGKGGVKAPSVFFPAPQFQFDKMVEGEELLHDFVIMNRGSETLQVQKVRTTCGCTTVSYSREIPPGGEGKISMKVNTRGYGGRKLTKAISVMTNDTTNPESVLTVSGNIVKFATITPPVVRLNGKAGTELKSDVKIIPEAQYPFSITRVRAQDGKNIRYELKESKSASEKKEYLITVESVKKDAGSYHDLLIIETDSKIQPEIKINVMGRLLDPDAPAESPLTGAAGTSGAAREKRGNFLEVIEKIQQQNAKGVNGDTAKVNNPAPAPDPARAEELKKQFEALIKQAQERQKLQEQQKASGGAE